MTANGNKPIDPVGPVPSNEGQPFAAVQPQEFEQRLSEDGQLTDTEKALIRAKAAKAVRDEQLKALSEAYYKQALREERIRVMPDEQLYPVFINLPGHAFVIRLDGNAEFYHGYMYQVPKRVKDVLKDTIARGWEHEHEVGGANRDQYRPTRGMNLTPANYQTANVRVA